MLIISMFIFSVLFICALIVNMLDQKKISTRPLANTRFGRYLGKIVSFDKVPKSLTKTLLFLLLNKLADLLDLKLLKL